MSQDEKICPVCDTKLSKETTKCPICGTDLAAIDEKAIEEVDISLLKDKTKAIDDILSLLEEEEKKVLEKAEQKEAEKKPEHKVEEEKEGKTQAPATEKEVIEKEKEKSSVDAEGTPHGVTVRGESPSGKSVEDRGVPAGTPHEGTVGGASPSVDAEGSPHGGYRMGAEPPREEEVFLCPLCNAEIPINASTCPKCGAIFEEAVVFVCPVCHAEVPVDANTCPKCGAIFVTEEIPATAVPKETEMVKEEGVGEVKTPITEEKKEEKKVEEKRVEEKIEKKVEKKPEDMAKELALKVSEAKVLLETLRKFGVDEKDIKDDISKALNAGKEKDYPRALSIMENALSAGKKSAMEKIVLLAAQLEEELRTYSKLGCDIRKGIGLCERAIFAAQTENFENAVRIYTQTTDFARKLKETFETRKKEFEALMHTVEEYRSFGIPGVSELKKLLEEAMSLYARGEIENGDKNLQSVKEKLNTMLPNYVTGKIAEQAAKLREEKLLGLDVKDKIDFLKEANMCIKKKDYAGALAWVKKLERKEL